MSYQSGITFQNFKSFKDKVSFDFSPFTILTGGNSSGKSTVFQALSFFNTFIADTIKKNFSNYGKNEKDSLLSSLFVEVDSNKFINQNKIFSNLLNRESDSNNLYFEIPLVLDSYSNKVTAKFEFDLNIKISHTCQLKKFKIYDDVLNIFRNGGDVYATFGAQMFNIPNLTKDSHPIHRQSAKSALLGAGYGLGWAAFAAQLLTGFLGAPPLRYTKEFAKQLGVTGEYVDKFLSWDDNLQKLEEIPHTCTMEELVIHCVAAKKIIDKYREAAYPVVGFWEMCSHLLTTSLVGGKEYNYKCLTFRKGEIELPNGMKLLYPDLRGVKDEKGRVQFVYGDDETKLYAGKITNNVTQALARIVMTDGMLRVTKRYPVVGTVHDEQIVMVPEIDAPDAKEWVLAQMIMEPKYMKGIPLNADVGTARRYGEAK
jgi:hypothetical protein